jgi:hypothetical protein
LLIGTILTPGQRTVTAALRVMGLKGERQFSIFHQVLNRASWSSLAVGKCLLGLLIRLIYPANEPLVFGIDETIERRWGEKIAARGIYRDPVQRQSFRQSQWLALDQPDVADAYSLGAAQLGTVCHDRACPLGTLL